MAPNLAGVPMVSVPCGEAHGMPVGLHFMADHLEEAASGTVDLALKVKETCFRGRRRIEAHAVKIWPIYR